MEFTMTGFSEDLGIRRYRFKSVLADRRSLEFAVDTDVAMARKYGIVLQELPLLCRRLLEKNIERLDSDPIVFSEELMREHASQCAATERAAQERRKSHRRPTPARLGEHWRGQQPPPTTTP
jgi:hypothetical protein